MSKKLIKEIREAILNDENTLVALKQAEDWLLETKPYWWEHGYNSLQSQIATVNKKIADNKEMLTILELSTEEDSEEEEEEDFGPYPKTAHYYITMEDAANALDELLPLMDKSDSDYQTIVQLKESFRKQVKETK